MWTPRRIVLLALGNVLVLCSYLGYLVGPLGAIDGLPTLPESLRRPGVTDPTRIEPPRPLRSNRIEERIKQAFGAESAELKWPVKLELNNRGLIVAALDFRFEEDGRLCLLPASMATFAKDTNSQPAAFPEINTLQGQVAYIKFDRPVTSLVDISGRRIVGAEISGNIRVRANRRTSDLTDDLLLQVGTGPLYYRAATHLIWTHDAVHIQDFQSKPRPMVVWGKGMEVELAAETAVPLRPAQRKQFTNDRITGVKRFQLQANVDMKFYVEGSNGFPGGGRTAKTPPAPGTPPPEKAQLTIKTSGRFRYDFLKDHDVASFLVPAVDPKQPARAPQHIVVERHFPPTNSYDHLFCASLVLHLRKKENRLPLVPGGAPAHKPAPATPGEKSMDILFAHAQGPQVTLTSDTEKLDATGVELIYDATKLRTTLRGEPQMTATKERNRIVAKELQITEHRPTKPEERPYQTAVAIGPGRLDVLDEKVKDQVANQAFWTEKMVTSRDGAFDLIVLTGAGRFVDRLNDQMLGGETLKVWVTLPDATASKTASPLAAPGSGTGSRRVHLLEAVGNVVTRSKELNIQNTSRLLVRFRDVPSEKDLPAGVIPGTTPKPSQTLPGPLNPATRIAPPETTALKPANPVPEPKPAAVVAQPKPTTPPAPPRPLTLSARNVEAWVVRAGPKNDMERVWCEGNVDVKQAAAVPTERGLSVKGDTLSMDCTADGNVLEVTGDLAELSLDRLYILGPVVNIDQPRNLAWVTGAGAMQVESKTNFAGENLGKAVPTKIWWKETMLFTGKTAEFKKSIQAEQGDALMLCDQLQIFFDKEVFLKGAQKGATARKPGTPPEEQARIKDMICDGNVRIEETGYAGMKVVKYQRIESGYVRMEAIEPDDDPQPGGKKAEQKSSDGNIVRGSGAGVLRLYQMGGVDPLGRPGDPKPKTEKGTDKEEPKLTYITYRNSMYANSKKNLVSFWGQVRVLNLPATDPLREIDLEKLVANLPPEALYLAADTMTVLNRGTKERSQQEMLAKGRVTIKAREFWGRAETVSFNEAKDQVILDGGEDGTATLFKDVGKGAPPQKIEGKKVTYIRSTGAFKVDEGRWISGE